MMKKRLGISGLVCAGLMAVGAAAQPVSVAILKYGEKAGAADSILECLKNERGLKAELITDITTESLRQFRVLILPQLPLGVVKDTPAYAAYDKWVPVLREWVEAGGGLMTLHDAVGYRSHLALFPQIAQGTFHDFVKREAFFAELVIANEKPFTPAFAQGDRVPLSYYDYVTLNPGPEGIILARGVDKTGEQALSAGPVIVFGKAGAGRYIANGTMPGILADEGIAPPCGAEKQLLLDCLNYLAGQVDQAAISVAELGAEHELGGLSANRILNGSFERITGRDRPYGVMPYNAGTMLSAWGLTNEPVHDGSHSVWLQLTGFKEAVKGTSGRGTAGLIFADALNGAVGETALVVPQEAFEYEFSFWVKGDHANERPPTVYVTVFVWKMEDGVLKRETLKLRNAEFEISGEWRRYAVRFLCEGYTRLAPMVGLQGTEHNVPRKGISGKLLARHDVPVGTRIFIDDVALVRLGKAELEGLTVEAVRAIGERPVTVKWRKADGKPPVFEKIATGASVEAASELLNLPDFSVWPANWQINDLSGKWRIQRLTGEATQAGYRRKTSLNVENDQGTEQGYWKPEYDDAAWQEIDVPSVWSDGDKKFVGIGWYRTGFAVPEIQAERRYILYFDRANYETTVYLNGAKIGINRGGSRPFEFDVTDLVRAGENKLAVRVFCDDTKYYVRSEHNGGIIGRVSLQLRPAVYAARILIDPQLATSELAVRLDVVNAGAAVETRDLTLNVEPSAINRRLAGRQGKAQSFKLGKQTFQPGTNALAFTVKLDNPVLWSPDAPHLYELSVLAGSDQIARDRFGFRSFGADGPRFLLNGAPIQPFGIVFKYRDLEHFPELWYNRGNIMRRLLSAYKELGITMIFPQGMHLYYPRLFYDMCDELGIMINEWHGAQAGSSMNKESALFDDADTAARMLYVYNHPSVVMFTIGNEVRDKVFIAPINHVYDLIKSLDSQKRPICDVSGGVPQTLRFKTDLCDIHLYPGQIHGHPLDIRAAFEGANRTVWESHGKAMPVGNWEMGAGRSVLTQDALQLGGRLFAAEKLDKEALIQGIIQTDSGYHMPQGLRWLTLYGLRRYCVDDAARALQDPEYQGVDRKILDQSYFVAKYRSIWNVKQLIEECRRLGSLMGGGFGLNNRTESFFYVRNAEGRLNYLKPNGAYQYPWFYAKDLAEGTLTATDLYALYRHCYAQQMICADVFDKNVFAGQAMCAVFYAINDAQSDAVKWQARATFLDQAGAILDDRTADIGSVAAMTRAVFECAIDLPRDLPTGFYEWRLNLLANGKVISDNSYKVFVMGVGDLDQKLDIGKRRIAVYDTPPNLTVGVLEKLGVKFERLADFKSLGEYDVLLIGAGSLDQTVGAAGAAIRAWLESGGRLLQFEQQRPNTLSWLPQLAIVKRLGGNVGNIVVKEHPIFDKIDLDDHWDTWNGRLTETSRGGVQGGVFSALISPLHKSVLAIGCQATPRETDTAARMLIADVKVGNGVALVSQAAATFRYEKDCVATKFVQNCLKYIISDETRFAEPVSGLEFSAVDARRCGYLDLSRLAQRKVTAAASWFEALEQGLKNCGNLRFKSGAKQMVSGLEARFEFTLPGAMQYMEPEWEAEKRARDTDQGALLKDRVDALYILASVPGDVLLGTAVARLTLCYKDGRQVVHELVSGRDIGVARDVSDLENARAAGGGMFVTAWQTPHVETPVVAILIEPLTDQGLLLGGITATLVRDKIHGL